MSSPVVSLEALPAIVQALTTLARELGIAIHFTVPESTPKPGIEEDQDDEQIYTQQRDDLTWLQSKIGQVDGSYPRLAGNYVAVHQQRIVAVSEMEEIARACAAVALSLDPAKILVVPVCVRDTESDDRWLEIKNKLGLE
jgi:hypothetical protein